MQSIFAHNLRWTAGRTSLLERHGSLVSSPLWYRSMPSHADTTPCGVFCPEDLWEAHWFWPIQKWGTLFCWVCKLAAVIHWNTCRDLHARPPSLSSNMWVGSLVLKDMDTLSLMSTLLEGLLNDRSLDNSFIFPFCLWLSIELELPLLYWPGCTGIRL